jgi:NADH-quinone oxidoreductase subunit L
MLFVSNSIACLVARFSVRYLHREPGFHRFFLLLALFVGGMNLLVLAGSYDLLFAGWEMVGIASMLLIAFFDHRAGPVRGAVRAMVTYRVADIGLLCAGVMLHQTLGSAEFADAFGAGAWPHAASAIPAEAATLIMLALLLSVMGKSAQFPLGGWLPRAMEGPTPSSALFYGALSVHAGVYLLLRSAPLLESSQTASIAVVTTGALTALYATLCGRTQSDAKNALAYATMTQVGLMLVGVGLHLWNWVIVHMFAHACLRLFQLLRTPSALRDAQELRAALRQKPTPRPSFWVRLLPESVLSRIYYLARHRFFLDEWLDSRIVAPLLRLAGLFERGELALLTWLSSDARAEQTTQDHVVGERAP